MSVPSWMEKSSEWLEAIGRTRRETALSEAVDEQVLPKFVAQRDQAPWRASSRARSYHSSRAPVASWRLTE